MDAWPPTRCGPPRPRADTLSRTRGGLLTTARISSAIAIASFIAGRFAASDRRRWPGSSPDYEDHRRNRLTHTLEVTQFARTLGRALSLNEDLVEAVALGARSGTATLRRCRGGCPGRSSHGPARWPGWA